MRVITLLLWSAATVATAETPLDASLLAVPRVAEAPRIDGVIAPGEWDAAAVTCGFRDNGIGHPARAPVVVSVCYDARALYCAFECRGEALDKLKGKAGQRDSSVWSGSLVELFLAPQAWPVKRYGHFMLHHTGTIADEMCDPGAYDASWNPTWEHAVGKAGDAWIAEMAIPWAAVGLGAPQSGEAFRVNFARNAAGIGELSTWARVRGGFHHPDQFGKLVLAEGGTAAAVRQLPGRATGPARVLVQLHGDDPDAQVQARLGTGAGELRQTRARLGASGGAELGIGIPGGAAWLEVHVADSRSRPLWSQLVELDLPDLPARISAVRARLEHLSGTAPRGPIAGLPAEGLADLRDQLEALAVEAGRPLDVAGLDRIAEQAGGIERQVTDLAMLVRAHERRGDRAPEELPSYFVTNPVCTRKIQPDCDDPGPPADELRIAMAKAEFEPAQIAVCAVREDLRKVRVSATSLRGPNGRVIPRDRVVVTPLGFVRCEKVTGGATLRGEVPDVLLPNRAVDVPAGRRQPFFITVQSTAEDAPGEYRGTVRVRAEGAPATRLPLTVRIYDVTLPVKSHLRTAFVLWGRFRGFLHTDDPDAYIGTYIRYSKAMLAHRISPITMWQPKKTPDGEWDFSDFDAYLSALAPLGLTTVNIGGNGAVAGNRDTAFARAAAAHLKERGWWDLHYVYGHDEASVEALEKLQTNYSALVEAVPDLKIMQTGWSPRPELEGLVRIWCPLTAGADMEAIRAAQEEGDEVWWYVCCGPLAPYANLFVDYPGIDHRILGWQTYQRGIEGFLYWGVDVWTHNGPPRSKYDEADYANWNPNSYSTINGDGYLLYPGPGDAPLPSMRLALLRDGFEDYDLFTEVAALAAREGRSAERARELLTFDEPLIPSLTDYTPDGNELLAWREEILKTAEKLGGAGR